MSGTSKPPASENEPRRKPEIGDDGFGDDPQFASKSRIGKAAAMTARAIRRERHHLRQCRMRQVGHETSAWPFWQVLLMAVPNCRTSANRTTKGNRGGCTTGKKFSSPPEIIEEKGGRSVTKSVQRFGATKMGNR
jgi:hypothetical protein